MKHTLTLAEIIEKEQHGYTMLCPEQKIKERVDWW